MACPPLSMITFVAVLFRITTAEQQNGAPVKIENVTVEYGPWEKQIDANMTLKFLKSAEVIIVTEGPAVDIKWHMNKWNDDGSDQQFESQVELFHTDGQKNLYKASLKTGSGKMRGIYEVRVRANGDYFHFKQNIYGQLYQHLSSGPDFDFSSSQLQLSSYPPKHYPLPAGEDEIVTLHVDATSQLIQNARAWRTKYVTTDGNVTVEYANLSPSMFEEFRPDIFDHVNFHSHEHSPSSAVSSGIRSFRHTVTISRSSKADIGRYRIDIHSGQQTATIYVNLVSSEDNPSLIAEPGIMLRSCKRGSAFDKGFMGVTMGTSNCINCRVFGIPEANIFLQKNGQSLISSFGHMLDGGQTLTNGASLIYDILSASEKDMGQYECRAVSAVNPNMVLRRSFEVAQYIKVTVNDTSESVGETQVKLTCYAKGYPLPAVDFYYYDPRLADVGADLVQPGQEFDIQHKQLDDQTVVYTLLAPKIAEGHYDTEYYCVGRNIFT